MWGIPVSFQCGIGIFRFLPLMASGFVGFPIRNYGGRKCHNANVALPPSVPLYRKNIPELEAARLQTKGKRLELQKFRHYGNRTH